MSGRSLVAVAVVLLLAGCSGSSPDSGAGGSDTLTRRQRDSIVGESGLPGAQGVKKTLEVSDDADARAARIDSLAGN